MSAKRASHVRGIVQLATQAVAGATRIAEGVHQSVWSTLGFPGGPTPGTTRGLTGFVYRGIGGTTRLVGGALDAALAAVEGFAPAVATESESPKRIAQLAVLNGVLGDHLAASGNPLALPMSLHAGGEAIDLERTAALRAPTARILLRIHGLCLTEQDWGARADGDSDHAVALAGAHGYTVVDLRYNTGLHVSQNGRALAALLERLVARWPVPVESIALLAHSMGGLVARSAVHYAGQDGHAWRARLERLAFLGTPHHGAPLERTGNLVDGLLSGMRYTAPFAALGRIRSAGITDLRHGHVLDEDWHGRDRFASAADLRMPVALPRGVACLAIGATASAQRGAAAEHLVGDGLVPLRSALGKHADPARALRFRADSQVVVPRTGHLALLRSPAVTQALLDWFAAVGPAARAPNSPKKGTRTIKRA